MVVGGWSHIKRYNTKAFLKSCTNLYCFLMEWVEILSCKWWVMKEDIFLGIHILISYTIDKRLSHNFSNNHTYCNIFETMFGTFLINPIIIHFFITTTIVFIIHIFLFIYKWQDANHKSTPYYDMVVLKW